MPQQHRVAPSRFAKVRIRLEQVEPDLIKKLLPHDLLLAILRELGICFRKTWYTPIATTWLWIEQCLQAQPCRHMATVAFARALAHGQDPPSTDGSAYCQARGRIQERMLRQVTQTLAQQVDEEAEYKPFGRCAYVLDGTRTIALDTPSNQREYPQSPEQKPGCGFPAIRLVGLFSLGMGVLWALALGPLAQSELALFYSLWSQIPAHSILLADRFLSSYINLALLKQKGHDCLMRLHAGRKIDFRKSVKRFAHGDGLFVWTKRNKPKWLAQSDYDQAPDSLTVRVVRCRIRRKGFRTRRLMLVTTLLDPQEYPAVELVQLYARRWEVEVDFRHIKNTLGMHMLNVKSPAMIRKAIWMHMLAYNSIRKIMLDVCKHHELSVGQISFSGTLDLLMTCVHIVGESSCLSLDTLYARLLAGIAQRPIRPRPNRWEPRAVKKRKKDFPPLTRPRQAKQALPHICLI